MSSSMRFIWAAGDARASGAPRDGALDGSREAFDAFNCCESQGGNVQVFDK